MVSLAGTWFTLEIFIPTDIAMASVRLSVMLSPPRPLDEIQQNLVCELLTRMGRATAIFFLAPPPGALGRGQKVKYHLISITKSISKIFIPNFVCVLTNVGYKTYQTGFSFCRLGHAPGVGLRGAWGAQGVKKFFSSNMVVWHIKSTGMIYQTLCVFSQMKDTKHIRWDFHSVPLVMPQGSDLGVWGCPGSKFFLFQTWSCGISN